MSSYCGKLRLDSNDTPGDDGKLMLIWLRALCNAVVWDMTCHEHSPLSWEHRDGGFPKLLKVMSDYLFTIDDCLYLGWKSPKDTRHARLE
jgi:hypothetical protein